MTTEHATEHVVVAASPASCWAVATDIERYIEWAQDIKEVTVLERNDRGLASKVAFRAAAMGRTTSYILDYSYPDGDNVIEWTLAEGDIMRRLDGRYMFETCGLTATSIAYELTVELLVPIPGFVKRRAEGKIMGTALRELRHRVETVTAA